jgi:hypothetical protein
LCNSSYQPKDVADDLRIQSHQTPIQITNDKTALMTESSADEKSPVRKKFKSSKDKKKHSRTSSDATLQHVTKPIKPNTIWISETTLDVKDAYHVDKKPDRSNLNYDTLYSGDQASYKRHFGNFCLGLDKDKKIKFSDRRNRVLKKSQAQTPVRYYQNVLEPVQSTELKFHHVQTYKNDDQYEEEENMDVENSLPALSDYLSLDGEDDGEIKKQHCLLPEVYLMQKTSYYNQLLLENPENIPLWLEFIEFQDESVFWGKIPESEEGLNLADSQHKKKLRQSLLERKIAIYERALKSNPYSIELIIGHMELVQEVWDTEELVTKWKNLVFYNASKSLLWCKYIGFCISRFSFFQTNTIISVFMKAISTLNSIADGHFFSHKPEKDAKKKILALYIFFCYFLRQTGYKERAVSTLQALVEFNLLYPSDICPGYSRYPRIERRSSMESYWNADVPRFGEDSTLGWTNWEHRKEWPVEPLGLVDATKYDQIFRKIQKKENEDDEDIDIKLVKGLPTNEAWLKLERYRDECNCIPRCVSEEDSMMNSDFEDPEHVTLYEDVMEVVFILNDPDLQRLLLVEFLRFLGAPCPGPSILQATFPHLTQVISETSEIMVTSSYLFHSLQMQGADLSACYFQPSPLGSEYGLSLDTTLFQDLHCNTPVIVQSPVPSHPLKFSNYTKRFISNVFNQSLSILPSDSNVASVLMCSWLQFEMNSFKSLLSENPNTPDVNQYVDQLHSLAVELLGKFSKHNYQFLWDFTISLEGLLTFKKKASTFSKALLQPFIESNFSEDSMFCMAQCFVEYMIGLRQPLNCYDKHKPDKNFALFALTLLKDSKFNPTLLPTSDSIKVSVVDKLETKNFFEEQNRKIISTIYAKMTTIAKDYFYFQFPKFACHIYFEYLCEGINEAITLCKNLAFKIKRIATDTAVPNHAMLTSLLENLYMLQTRLIISHGSQHPMKPQILRDFVGEILHLFPTHTWFLRLLLESEKRSFISGQLRRYFDKVLSKTVSVVPLFYAIRSELERNQYLIDCSQHGVYLDELSSSTVHRVRSLFRRGTNIDCCRLCPAFWRCYMKFEIEQGNMENAKAVFYQAINNCPGVKVIYTDAIHYFPEDITKIIEMTDEKLIRVRTPLDVVLFLQDDIEQRNKLKETSSNDS